MLSELDVDSCVLFESFEQSFRGPFVTFTSIDPAKFFDFKFIVLVGVIVLCECPFVIDDIGRHGPEKTRTSDECEEKVSGRRNKGIRKVSDD